MLYDAEGPCINIPGHSSSQRRYVPIGGCGDPKYVALDPDATLT
jgi:hypothetical protein